METRRQIEDEKDFYDDLDKNNTRFSNSCQMLVIGFAVLLIATSVGSFYLIRKIQSIDIAMPKIPGFGKMSAKKEVKDRQIKIYDNDLQSKMSGPIGSLIPLKNKKASIKPEGIILEGSLANNTKEKLTFIAEPVVKNQKIALENVRLKTGNSNKATDLIYKSVGESIALMVNQMISLNVSEIELKNGEMDITVY